MTRRVLTIAFVILGWALVAATAVAIWLHYYPSRGRVTLWLTSAVPFATVSAVLAVVIFAVLRRWFMTAAALAVTAGLAFTQAPLWVAQDAPEGGDPVVMVSSNLMLGSGDVDALARIVDDADADLVSLQEVTPESLDRVRASDIGRQFPYVHAEPGDTAHGTALFSRTPLTGLGRVDNTLFANLRADTDLPGAPGTRVMAVHPAAPIPDSWDWASDMEQIRSYMHALDDGPVIVAGDFNATWDQVRFRNLLKRGYADATEQAGAGFLPTYPTDRLGGNRPVIAIDHVLARGFTAISATSHYLPGSDHRVLVVSLVAS